VGTPELRLRVASPGLLDLPWQEPLERWDPTAVELRDLPVGPSRHVVRFVEADGALWALKAMPERTAVHEYEALRRLEDLSLPAVRAAGVVAQPSEQAAILVTHYLEGSWQYRRLLLRTPASMTAHRGRLFDAMAVLLVDLHRTGVYWGDCSLANTLFMRDGQALQAWMVDAETAELHPSLSVGQRRMDLEVMVENVAGGLLDVAARRGEPPDAVAGILEEPVAIAARYDELWALLHDEPVVGFGDHHAVERRLRRLNEAGFALDEFRLEPAGGDGAVRVRVAVAGRSFHAEQLRRLTGLDTGEGRARILMNDLHAHHTVLVRAAGEEVPEEVAARRWIREVFEPGTARAHTAIGGRGDGVQAYCDFLEVRWLLSEESGADVGDDAALAALEARQVPEGSAAEGGFVELATGELPRIDGLPGP